MKNDECISKKQILYAKSLRKTEFLNKIPNDKPGWYKWWATRRALEKLLNSEYIDKRYLEEILPYLTMKTICGEKYYSIYVGIAVKESIRSRLNWHVNQHHSENSVKSGFLSTLRKSISSLVAGSQYNEILTNELIDMLIIEYNIVDLPIKSLEAKEKIEKIENDEMKYNVLPLNIKGNNRQELKEFKKQLRNLRKKSKDEK